ncbi:MAG: methionine synthase [Acidobacteria bacterium]|nr:methionine synthase [Acidobacteriota bacterium]
MPRDIREALAERVLVLDGATGTRLQQERLTAADFGGPAQEGCYEALVLTRPDLVAQVHREYLEAGADIIETDTFGATPIVLAEYDLSGRAREINRLAAAIARRTADEHEADGRGRWVAGSIGPTTRSLLLTGGVDFATLARAYEEQALGLVEGGADYLLVETASDPLNVKAALDGIDRAFAALGRTIPVAVSMTVEASGVTLCGQSAESFYTSVEHRELLYIGMNCAVGPEFMTDPVRSLAAIAEVPIACVPNAGLPDENGRYLEGPEKMGATLERFLAAGWLNLVGGCCGTTAAHVAEFARIARQHRPRRPVAHRWARVAGIDFLSLEEDRLPLQVGERTNVIGSRKFRQLVAAGEWERAAEVGAAQVKGGAHILDVCLADPDRDEAADTERLLDALVRRVRVPLMIDSTDADVIERALRRIPGKALINSVNLEDGEERFARVVPLARRYGAALVVGCIDEDRKQGMAVTAARKLAIARRSHELLTQRYGVPATDLVFDPLVFPCGSGDANYRGSARETIEGVRAIKREIPGAKTILGISNVSFGLPPAGREVLNSVFLHECTEAGLDLAIVNSEKIVRYASIPAEELAAALDLLYDRGEDPIARFAALYRGARTQMPAGLRREPVELRLARRIVDARREGLEQDLEDALTRHAPLDVINGPLLDGMGEVGRLFARNELIVAEVLQSAEVMKAAVSYLESYMETSAEPRKGTVLLATVKGDVHDIGKNLVGILLANNGFRVVDLGIKVDPATLAQAIRDKRPDIVGLSGLLVKSAQQMALTAADLKELGIGVPMLVGGAALSRRFTETRIAPAYGGSVVLYARDAMEGLALANRLADPGERAEIEKQAQAGAAAAAPEDAAPEPAAEPRPAPASPRAVLAAPDVPAPPDFARHVFEMPAREALGWVNPQMLYGRHLGLRGNVQRLAEQDDPKLAMLRQLVDELIAEFEPRGSLRTRGVYRFFAAEGDGDTLVLRDRPSGAGLARFTFPRQPGRERMCISDWVEPAGQRPDAVAAFVVTAGTVRADVERLKEAGEFLRSHALAALALELAEGTAEALHARLRREWGFPDPPELSLSEMFRARYRGLRVSFGYPACPALEDQAQLFQLLQPEDVGVRLTDGFMMDPEASVSALVFHHPQAKYFSAGGQIALAP